MRRKRTLFVTRKYNMVDQTNLYFLKFMKLLWYTVITTTSQEMFPATIKTNKIGTVLTLRMVLGQVRRTSRWVRSWSVSAAVSRPRWRLRAPRWSVSTGPPDVSASWCSSSSWEIEGELLFWSPWWQVEGKLSSLALTRLF